MRISLKSNIHDQMVITLSTYLFFPAITILKTIQNRGMVIYYKILQELEPEQNSNIVSIASKPSVIKMDDFVLEGDRNNDKPDSIS